MHCHILKLTVTSLIIYIYICKFIIIKRLSYINNPSDLCNLQEMVIRNESMKFNMKLHSESIGSALDVFPMLNGWKSLLVLICWLCFFLDFCICTTLVSFVWPANNQCLELCNSSKSSIFILYCFILILIAFEINTINQPRTDISNFVRSWIQSKETKYIIALKCCIEQILKLWSL